MASVKQFNLCTVQSASRQNTVYQCSGRHRPIHSYTVGNKILANVIELQTLRRAKQHVPQNYKIHTPKGNQNAKRTSAQQQSHGMSVTSTVTARARYSGTSNQTQIAKKFTAFPTLIRQCCRTRGHVPPVTLNTPRRRSTDSMSFPLSLSFSLIWFLIPYLLSEVPLSGLSDK